MANQIVASAKMVSTTLSVQYALNVLTIVLLALLLISARHATVVMLYQEPCVSASVMLGWLEILRTIIVWPVLTIAIPAIVASTV